MSSVFLVVALSLAVMLLLTIGFVGLIAVSNVVHSFAGQVFKILIFSTAIYSVAQTLFTGRELLMSDSGLERLAGGDAGDILITKIFLALIIAACVGVCIAWALWNLAKSKPPARYTAAGVAHLNKLTFVFLIYYIAFSLLPLVAAPQFAFHVSLVYPLFVWLALLLAWRSSTPDPVVVIRDAMALIVLSSLAAAAFMPSLALQPGYEGLIPGFDRRLWGVTTGPNAMGSVASILLVLQFIERPRSSMRHYFITLGALIALVLSQSKASIGAAMLGLAILAIWRVWHGPPDRPSDRERVVMAVALLAFFGVAITAAIWSVLNYPGLLHALERRLDPNALDSLSTATGRTYIWQYAMKSGMESPLFGQGISIWSKEARATIGFYSATDAHNLYLQTFSVAGAIGLMALFTLLVLIASFAVKAAVVSRGGSLALFSVLLVRSFFEVAFQPNTIHGAEFLAIITTMVFVTDRALCAQGALREHPSNGEILFHVSRLVGKKVPAHIISNDAVRRI